MTSRIVEEVGERIAHLARRLQRMRVIAIGEDRPRTTPGTIERPRDAHARALHAAGERTLVIDLAHQVEMIAQHREVHEPQAQAIGSAGECVTNGVMCSHLSQAWQPGLDAKRDVQRMARRNRRSSRVCDVGPIARRLATCAPSRATPTRILERDLLQLSHVAPNNDDEREVSPSVNISEFFRARPNMPRKRICAESSCAPRRTQRAAPPTIESSLQRRRGLVGTVRSRVVRSATVARTITSRPCLPCGWRCSDEETELRASHPATGRRGSGLRSAHWPDPLTHPDRDGSE